MKLDTVKRHWDNYMNGFIQLSTKDKQAMLDYCLIGTIKRMNEAIK